MSVPDSGRAAARADLCRLLAACYYLPGPEFGEERVFDAMRQAAAGVAPDVSDAVDALGTAFEAQPLQDLQVDYTALFLSPAGASATPYASLWIGGNDPARDGDVRDCRAQVFPEPGDAPADQRIEVTGGPSRRQRPRPCCFRSARSSDRRR